MVQICKMIIFPGFFFNFQILIFWIARGLKGLQWPKMTKISVCRTLYFRNDISNDLHLWYTCIYKGIITPGIYFIFFLSKFQFQFWNQYGGEGGMGYLMNHTSYDCNFWYTCKMMISPSNFFIFKILILGAFYGVKGQKMT